MREVVVAIYNSALAAETAAEDVTVARVPSASVRKFVTDPRKEGELLEVWDGAVSGERVVAVTVEARHASAVTSILGMQSPVKMAEVLLKAA
jgi:hypothetical protein